MDDDRTVNGLIEDPLYIGIETDTQGLASTGANILYVAGAAGILIAAGLAALALHTRKGFRR